MLTLHNTSGLKIYKCAGKQLTSINENSEIDPNVVKETNFN